MALVLPFTNRFRLVAASGSVDLRPRFFIAPRGPATYTEDALARSSQFTGVPTLFCLRVLFRRRVSGVHLPVHALAVGVCTLVAFQGANAYTARSHARSIAAYRRAETTHRRLEAKPISARTRLDYERALNAYRAVYHGDPASPDAAPSIAAVADLLAEEGRCFHDGRLLHDAVGQWEFLRKQYPGSPLRRRAVVEEARIEQNDLHSRAESRAGLHDSSKRSVHQRNTAEETSYLESKSASGAGMQPTHRQTTSSPTGAAISPKAPQPEATIQQVRYWSKGTSTRIAVNMTAAVDCRLYPSNDKKQWTVVFFGTRPAASFNQTSFQTLHGGNLVSMHLSALTANQTALVLQLSRPASTSSFHLSNPNRWVVDLNPTPARPAVPAATKPAGEDFHPSSVAQNTPANPPMRPANAGSAMNFQRSAVGTTQPSQKPSASGQDSMARVLGLRVRRIVIDAGHGGHDSGTLGPDGVDEKNVALDVALRLGHLLHQRLGADVIYTRTTDKFVPLEERTAIANRAHADLFISIHANSSSDPQVRGVETYYLNFTSSPDAVAVAARENAASNHSVYELSDLVRKIALSDKIDESRVLAQDVQQSLYGGLEAGNAGLKDRGVKQAPFVVLIGAHMPSILAEISFLTNPEDAFEMSQPAYQKRIAESLYRGVARYVQGMDVSSVRVANTASPNGTSDTADPDSE